MLATESISGFECFFLWRFLMTHQGRMELQLGGYGVGYRGMCRFRCGHHAETKN